jgi:hypothetical protein
MIKAIGGQHWETMFAPCALMIQALDHASSYKLSLATTLSALNVPLSFSNTLSSSQHSVPCAEATSRALTSCHTSQGAIKAERPVVD